jgi:hypothetical protein
VRPCSLPCSPPPGRHPGPGPAPVSAAGAKAAPQPGRRPSGGPGYGQPHWLRSTSCEPATANAAPSPPVRPDAGRRPRRPQTTAARRPAAPGRGGPPHRATPGASARTRRRQRRGHRRRVRPDTWRPRSLDTGHLDAGCPLDRLDGHPTADRTRRTGHRPGLAGVPTSLRPATPAGRPDLARVTAPGALGHPRRLHGDGICAAALTAAATRPLPSTAQHEAAPRRTALLGRFRVERRANGEASSVMASRIWDRRCGVTKRESEPAVRSTRLA